MSVQALNKIIPISAQGDIFAFAQEDDWADRGKIDVSSPKSIDLIDSKRITGGDFLPKGLLITETALVRNKEIIELMYKTGNAARTGIIPGTETSGGNISALLTADDNVVVFQNLAQDKNPKFKLLGDVGTKTTQLDIVFDQSITTDGNFNAMNGNVTVGENTKWVSDLTGLPTAVEVVVTLTGATLSGASATVDVEGINNDGDSDTVRFTFTDSDKGVAQESMVKLRSVRQVRWAGFTAGTLNVKTKAVALPGMLPNAIDIGTNLDVTASGSLTLANNLSTIENPVQITLTPNSAAGLKSGKTFATVRIVGIDIYDNPMDKTVTFIPDASGDFTALTTLAFWKQINNVYGDPTNWAASSTVNIRATDKSCEVEIHPQDSVTEQFLTVAGNKGGIPDRHISQFITGVTIGNARNEAMMFQIETMGYRALLRTDMSGTEGVGAQEIDFTNLSPASPFVYPGWATRIEIAGVIQPYTNSAISLAQGFDYSGVQSGTPYEEVRPYRNDRRAVAIEGQVVRTKDRDLVGAYAAGVVYEDVKYIMEMRHAETFNWKTEIVLRESQIRAETDVGSPAGIDRYQQQYNLGAKSDNFGSPRDWYAKIRLSNYNRVRSYA